MTLIAYSIVQQKYSIDPKINRIKFYRGWQFKFVGKMFEFSGNFFEIIVKMVKNCEKLSKMMKTTKIMMKDCVFIYSLKIGRTKLLIVE